jgi:transposase-like protein
VRVKGHPRAFWEKLVAEVESGSSLASVARRHSVRAATLSKWRTEIRRRPSRSSMRLLPVVTAHLPGADQRIEVRLGEIVLRVQEGTGVDYVAALARALKNEC